MHEGHPEPARHERRLGVDDALEQRQGVVAGVDRVRVVPLQRVGRQRGDRFVVAPRCEELEGAYDQPGIGRAGALERLHPLVERLGRRREVGDGPRGRLVGEGEHRREVAAIGERHLYGLDR